MNASHIPDSKKNVLSYRNHNKRAKIIPNIEIVRFNGKFESTFVSLHLTYSGQGKLKCFWCCKR